MILRTLLTASLLSLLSACVSHYRYESAGTVVDTEGQQQAAMLYWFVDDGRLWYGKPYKMPDSGVTLLVCDTTAKSFDGGDAGEPLMLKSRSGDRLVASNDGSNQVIMLDTPTRLPPGSQCGTIGVDGKLVSSAQLTTTLTPGVSILCDNQSRPNRYPKAGRYRFDPIERIKVKGNAAPADICTSSSP